MNDRALDTIVNPRMLRIKERTLAWQFDMVYVPGNKQAAADKLSRKEPVAGLASLAVWETKLGDMEDQLQEDMEVSLLAVSVPGNLGHGGIGQQLEIMSVEAQPMMITWTMLQDATKEDKVLTKLIEVIQRGMPDSSNELLKELRDYHKYRHGLVVVDGVVTYKRRLVIPHMLRGRILETLHAAHQGVSGMINRAE